MQLNPLFLTLSLLPHALPLPQLLPSCPILPPPITTTTNLTADPQCHDGFGTTLNSTVCLAAISLLPMQEPGDVQFDRDTGTYIFPAFSSWSPNPRFFLPVRRRSEACFVNVVFRPGVHIEHSSWFELRLTAMTIVEFCVEDRGGLGGARRAGVDWDIVVTINEQQMDGSGVLEALESA